MRPVAIAIAAFSVLALPVAAPGAHADQMSTHQMFAQGASPAVGGNGQSGNPAISPDSPVPTDPQHAAPATGTMTTHHHHRHHRHHHAMHHHMTPSTSSTPAGTPSSSAPPAPSTEPPSSTTTPAPGGSGSGK